MIIANYLKVNNTGSKVIKIYYWIRMLMFMWGDQEQSFQYLCNIICSKYHNATTKQGDTVNIVCHVIASTATSDLSEHRYYFPGRITSKYIQSQKAKF